ncbi:MAG: hypothetical protein WBG46_02535 [Nonlabens sp.]
MEKSLTNTKELYWRAFLKTQDYNKATQISNSIFEVLKSCSLISCKPYWKDSTLYELEFRQKLKENESSKIIIEVFSIIVLFSNTWKIDIPTFYNAEDFELSGLVKDNINHNGISWISFVMQNICVR